MYGELALRCVLPDGREDGYSCCLPYLHSFFFVVSVCGIEPSSALRATEGTILRPLFSGCLADGSPSIARMAKDGGGGNSQTEHAKIGTAVPYFPKVPFEASHLSFGNANIVSNSVEPATFSPGGFQAELSLFSIQNKGRWF